MTEIGKVFGQTAAEFATTAVVRAAADAGVAVGDIDGMLVSSGIHERIGLRIAEDLGMRDLRMLAEVNSFGATATAMVQQASLAILSGAATTVACVFADAPLVQDRGSAGAYSGFTAAGTAGYALASGVNSATAMYALGARRHMETYGTTKEQLGAVAVSTRAWATRNPLAQHRTPLSLEQYLSARMITDPLGLYDCCLVSNGGIAVIVTSAERAADGPHAAVNVVAWAQSHLAQSMERGGDFGIRTGAAEAAPRLFAMAGIDRSDVTVAELYDCFTYTTLVTLEDYGFCQKGEGGPFVESGAIAPGGSLPVNTGGGELSSYYMWGMTPLSEGIIQCRGEGGERQVADHDVVLVTGNGGFFEHHGGLILSPVATLRAEAVAA
ncbi:MULTISPECIES: thiolase family protein [Microbacterium]|uniref:Thiolase family protein n=1 Tax=Microbacterium wangchenii TaxID=2541726 RepID=A0ABX5SPC1_9MICO|nr:MULTISPECIES: thiolase family protein [Microbacterium]MCK6066659.1 thiolase family protein [Microbacterium sp. EYE_512]QBR87990.1 thiolase family protein [Microbacterium wangchenii]TXK18220.1 thiolase family protein [Microbacterium wangchenii]